MFFLPSPISVFSFSKRLSSPHHHDTPDSHGIYTYFHVFTRMFSFGAVHVFSRSDKKIHMLKVIQLDFR